MSGFRFTVKKLKIPDGLRCWVMAKNYISRTGLTSTTNIELRQIKHIYPTLRT